MGELSISDGQKTTSDGQIESVQCEVSGEYQYNVPDKTEPDTWQTVLMVRKSESNEWAKIAATNGSATYLRGAGEFALAGSVTQTEQFSVQTFESTTDGETKETELDARLNFQVFNPEQKVLALANLTDTATVKVTNNQYSATEYGNAKASGEVIVR